MDELALYPEVCTVVRTYAGLSEGWSASRQLYADELLLMAPTMEQHGRHVTEWTASILNKGLKVNAGNNDCILWKVALIAQYVQI